MSPTNPVHAYLEALVAAHGSDLHLNSSALPTIRAHGRIVRIKRDEQHHVREMSPDEMRGVILATMPAHLHSRWESEREVDYSYDAGEGIGRFRVNAYFDLDGPAAVLRSVPAPPASMEDVGLPPSVHGLVDQPNGLILLIGPTGAGKSTTMAAFLNEVNNRRGGVILTIEEPIEFAYANRGCVVTQREVGTHTLSFAAATRSGLRQDPDVIGVGEIRDAETLTQVLGLAETGHLVFSTGHGSSVASGLGRLLGLPEAAREDATRRQLAGVFRAVIAQALVPRADGEGRLPAFEVLYRTTSTVNKIRDGNLVSLRSDMNDRASGMITLERSLAELVVRGEVREEDAVLHSNEPDQLRGELRAATAGSY